MVTYAIYCSVLFINYSNHLVYLTPPHSYNRLQAHIWICLPVKNDGCAPQHGRNDLSLLVLHHDFYNPREGFFLSYMLLQTTLRSFEGLWIPVLKTKAKIILKKCSIIIQRLFVATAYSPVVSFNLTHIALNKCTFLLIPPSPQVNSHTKHLSAKGETDRERCFHTHVL